MCVSVSVYVCMRMCIHIHDVQMYACTYGDQKLMLVSSSIALLLVGVSTMECLTDSARLAFSQAQGPSSLQFPSVGCQAYAALPSLCMGNRDPDSCLGSTHY